MVGVDLRRDVVETVLMDLIKQEVNIVKRVSLPACFKKCRKEGRKSRHELTRHIEISFKRIFDSKA